MGPLKGYKARISIPLQQFTKQRLVKEDGTEAVGDGSTTVFYTQFFPVTDSSGNTTNDTSNITVYDEDDNVLTVSDLDGATGKITLSSAPASGTKLYCTYYTKTDPVAYCTGEDETYDHNVDVVHQLASEDPFLVSGPRTITITFTRAIADHLFIKNITCASEENPFRIKIEEYSGGPALVCDVVSASFDARRGVNDLVEGTLTLQAKFVSRG